MQIIIGQDKINNEYFLKKINGECSNVKHFYYNKNIIEIWDELQNQNLFGEEKIYVIHNASFIFASEKNEIDFLSFLNSFKNNELYIVCENSLNKKINNILENEKNKIVKIDKFNEKSKKELIDNLINENKLIFANETTIEYLNDFLPTNPFIIENEIIKLSLLKDKITQETITKFCHKFSELNIFNIIDLLLQNKLGDVLRTYDDLIINGIQPLAIIQILSPQLFNLKLFKIAQLNKMPAKQIYNDLCINFYMQKKYQEIMQKIDLDFIEQILDVFLKTDYNLKRGGFDHFIGVKLALIKSVSNLIKNER